MAHNRAMSLAAFLKSAKQNLPHLIKQRQPVTLVIGNQSADLDSFTSSMVYAYFRTQKSKQDAIPLLNIPAADLQIRPEFHQAMRYAEIDSADLNTLDDLGPSEKYAETLPPDQTTWLLTDHNKLEGLLGQTYGWRVVGAIDHHEDEHSVPENNAPEPRVIQVCGSCTTLVVREIRPVWDELRQGSPPVLSAEESAKIAKFAVSSILIDTRNLQNPDKTTPDDIEVVDYLKSKIAEADGPDSGNLDEFFVSLKDAKNDIKSMSAEGVFRKDYKEWNDNGVKLGTSSAVKRLEKLAKKVSKEQDKNKDAWQIASLDFMKGKGVDLWLVLTSFNDDDGKHKRELALHWTKPELKAIADRFEEVCGKELELERSKVEKLPASEDTPGRRTWLQSNGAMSRKQVAPMLRRVITGN